MISAVTRWAAALLLAVLLVGCGRDNFDAVRNLRATGETIVCLGDSLTEGVGADSGLDYPSVLSRQIGMPIVNKGRRGDTTADALTRLKGVLDLNPRLVIVFLGGNDFLRQVPRAESKRNLAEIVRRVHDHGAMVAIAGMKLGLFSDEFGPIYEELAQSSGALYIPQVMNGILTDSNLKSDPIHPNSAGYKLVAERIADKIRPLLREADRLTGRRAAS
jgi:acyl-CoA thioesterase-1